MIMDIRAARRLKVQSRVLLTWGARALEFRQLSTPAGRRPLHGSFAGSPRMTVSKALLIAGLSLCFAGCAAIQSNTTVSSTPLPPPATTGVPRVASVMQQPELPAKQAPPASQPLQRAGDPLPATATASGSADRVTASRGAERLAAPTAPGVVRAREKPPVKAEPGQPQPPIVADSGAGSDAPVKELVFKGPPPEVKPRVNVKKLLLWFGVVFGVGALAIVARLCLTRRAEPIEAPDPKKKDSIAPPGLLLKESVNLPQEALVIEQS
jgi:hypothetical protein